jgi:predicted dehydrogenase
MMTVGLIGAGKWGKNYIRTIAEIDSNIKILIGNRLNWYELIQSKMCDAIIIATPPDSHIKIAVAALECNLPVMLEKPLALSYHEALTLQKYDCSRILVNHLQLFSSAYQHMKKEIDPIDIVSISSRGSNNGPTRDYSSLLDYGPHDLSMGMYLTQNYAPDLQLLYKVNTENGSLYHLGLQYSNINHDIVIGNGDISRHRMFRVNAYNGIWEYDDTQEQKLFWNGQPVKIETESPLKNATKCFLQSIEGYIDDRFGLNLALSVTKTLDACYKVLK